MHALSVAVGAGLLLAVSTETLAGSTGRVPASARIGIQRVKLQSRVAGPRITGSNRTAVAQPTFGTMSSAGSTNATGSPTIFGSPRKVEIISVVEGDQIAIDR